MLYSLRRALQDLGLVFVISTGLYLTLAWSGVADVLLGWAQGHPQLPIDALFLYGTLVAIGFGIAILRRWIELSELSRYQDDMRQELARKADQLEQRNRELERLAYAASHDLREPLRMIHTYLGLVERRVEPEELDADARLFLEEARNASDRMDRMVRGIVKYARMDPQAAASEPTDVEAALEQAVAELEPQLDEQDVIVDRGHLPRVLARRDELVLVFRNLLQNAIVHGGPELERIEVAGHVDDGEAVIRLRDDGSGFDAVDGSQAFDLFRQGNGSSTSAGAGLGLTLCRRIVERHGGSIETLPDVAEGAGFEIRLEVANAVDERLSGFSGSREGATA